MATLLAIATALVVFVLHRWWLRGIADRIDRADGTVRQSLHFGELVVAHLVGGAIFAVAFWLGALWDFGGFEHGRPIGSADLLTFSLVNITTLGLGDILVDGHLRIMAGIESLTGFLMLSCSAQLVWKQMNSDTERQAS